MNSKLFFLLQKEISDLKVQLTSTAEKEQNYLKQLMAMNTDLEREAYDHFWKYHIFFWCYIEVTSICNDTIYDSFLIKNLNLCTQYDIH